MLLSCLTALRSFVIWCFTKGGGLFSAFYWVKREEKVCFIPMNDSFFFSALETVYGRWLAEFNKTAAFLVVDCNSFFREDPIVTMGLASVSFFLFSIAASGSLEVTYLLTLLMCMTSYCIGKSSFLNSSSSLLTFLIYENSFSESNSLMHSIYCWFWLLFIILSTEWFRLLLLAEDRYSSSSACPFVECFFEGASSLETRST